MTSNVKCHMLLSSIFLIMNNNFFQKVTLLKESSVSKKLQVNFFYLIQMQYNFLQNCRGGLYLLHEGFMYSVRTRRVNRHCPLIAVTMDNFNIPVSFGRRLSNHCGDLISLAADSFVSRVKKRCRGYNAELEAWGMMSVVTVWYM